MGLRRHFAAIVALLALVTAAPRARQAPPAPAPSASSVPMHDSEVRAPRIASYDIDVELDERAHRLTGTATIRWLNTAPVPATTLQFHLYWNAWRSPTSTWFKQRALAGEADGPIDLPAGDEGWQNFTCLVMRHDDGGDSVDLMRSLRFIAPDDGNALDKTLAEVTLPSPVPPGQSISIVMEWSAKVPRTFARTGHIGNAYFLAQWFPKIGVFGANGWNAHQFFANTEFFADFGSYDVRITVPAGWVVGATGVEQSRTPSSAGTVTHRYTQDDVHDFAWTTSPDYVEHRQTFQHPSLPKVEMRLLLQPEHAGQEDRHFAAAAAAQKYYGEWFGAYSYSQLTIVDPAWQSGAGGMEYPTLFTAGSRWLAPRASTQPEGVTVHEAGHQFWYGMVANDEVADAWMDEGLNTFSEARVLSEAFAPDYRVERFFGGFIPWQQRDMHASRVADEGLNGYRLAAEWDPLSNPSYRFWPGSHEQTTYSKAALWLHTLERYLTWERMQPVLATYFERWRFRHPTPQDFFAVVSEKTDEDMTWFTDTVYRSTSTFDYGIERLQSVSDGASGHLTTVVARRFGDGVFPVTLLVTFASGEQVRESWNGADRWRVFTYNRASPVVSAIVDPERVLLLDLNYTNNSQTLAPRANEAARKWSLSWMVWLQDLLLTSAFFV